MKQFQKDLLESVRQMKSGKAARETSVAVSSIVETRTRSGLTQSQFASLLNISPRTLQEWEQGRSSPTGAAKTLLRVVQTHPELLRELAA